MTFTLVGYNSFMGESQSTRVEQTPEGQIRITFDRVSPEEQISREFIFEVSAGAWLAEKLLLAADDNLHNTDGSFPPDQFRVTIGGGQRYDDINVNLSNERDPTAPHGKLYTLSGMEVEVARNLADQLRQFVT